VADKLRPLLQEEDDALGVVSAPRRKRKLGLQAPLTAATESTVSRRDSLSQELGLDSGLQSQDESELYAAMLRSYPGQSLQRGRRKRLRGERRPRPRRHKEKRRQDCKVATWGLWGPCSKTCDIGEWLGITL